MSVEGLLQTAAEITLPRATVGVRETVASLWQLPLKRIYLGTALGAGRELHRHVHALARTAGEAILCACQQEGSQTHVSVFEKF